MEKAFHREKKRIGHCVQERETWNPVKERNGGRGRNEKIEQRKYQNTEKWEQN